MKTISHTALCKTCDRHDIPTPGRGYWAQGASGQSFARPPLRPAKAPRVETVRIVGAPRWAGRRVTFVSRYGGDYRADRTVA